MSESWPIMLENLPGTSACKPWHTQHFFALCLLKYSVTIKNFRSQPAVQNCLVVLELSSKMRSALAIVRPQSQTTDGGQSVSTAPFKTI